MIAKTLADLAHAALEQKLAERIAKKNGILRFDLLTVIDIMTVVKNTARTLPNYDDDIIETMSRVRMGKIATRAGMERIPYTALTMEDGTKIVKTVYAVRNLERWRLASPLAISKYIFSRTNKKT
jgi:hypothetical protein